MTFQLGPVRFVPGPRRGKYPYCHSLYVQGERRVLIDPGSDRAAIQTLVEEPGIDAVWLSHYHEDHLAHLDLFDDSEVWVPALDEPPLRSTAAFLDAYGMREPGIRQAFEMMLTHQFNFRPRTSVNTFADDEVVDLGGVTAEVIRTPGHTAGHCSFFFREPEVLFLGDYDLTRFGPWYGDVGSDIDETIASVNRLREVPARTWIACHEHGVYETNPGALWDEFLAVIAERDDRLLDLLRAPRTMAEIVEARIIYRKPREPRVFFDFAEQAMMQKHVDRLVVLGEVHRDGDAYVVTRG